MIRVNLLPHRELRRKAQLKRDGIGAALFLVIVVGVLTSAFLYLKQEVRNSQQRVAYMQDALADTKKKLDEVSQLEKKRQKLLEKIRVIKKLQEGRDLSVRIFQALGHAVPEEVSLRSVRQNKAGLQLKGVAKSNTEISSLMRRLEASDLFSDPDLQVITNKTKDGNSVKEFEMGVALVDAGEEGKDSQEKNGKKG